MSVLVKGMKMPKGCHSGCPLTDRDAFTCQITGKDIVFYDEDTITSRPSWCPLVEVKTPHGRLIDADALMAKLNNHRQRLAERHPKEMRDLSSNIRGVRDGIVSGMSHLGEAPTVIEAEADHD